MTALAARPLPPRQRLTEDWRLAVHVPRPDVAGYLALALEEIAHWGADNARTALNRFA